MTRTVVLGPPPSDLQQFIDRRREQGLDGYDEVWDGEYHVAPMARASHGIVQQQMLELLGPAARAVGLAAVGPFNLGASQDDFRVPDGGVLNAPSDEIWVPQALVVLEVLSPDDETFDKFDYYAAHGVQEVIVADPVQRTVVTYDPASGPSTTGASRRLGGSRLLDLTDPDMTRKVRWP